MKNIKSIVEMVRKTEPSADDAQIKSYSNPRHNQYRSQDERLKQNKGILQMYHFSSGKVALQALNAINTVHTAFDQFGGDLKDPSGTQKKQARMANVSGFLADVLASGIEFSRAHATGKLSPEEMQRVAAVGKDKAMLLVMHEFAKGLLPKVIGIDPGETHHLHMDQSDPRKLRNHEFIHKTLTSGFLPSNDVVTENKILGSELLGDLHSHIRTKLQGISDRAYDVGQARGGLKYDPSKTHWVDRAIDNAAIFLPHALGRDRFKAYIDAMGPIHNAEPEQYKPTFTGTSDQYDAQRDWVDPIAHHKYYPADTEHLSPFERETYAYHGAVAANDAAAIISAAEARRNARMSRPGDRINIADKFRAAQNPTGERSRKMTFSSGPPATHPDETPLPSIKTNGGVGVRNRKEQEPEYKLPPEPRDDSRDWMDRDEEELNKPFTLHEPKLKGFSATMADIVTKRDDGTPHIVDPTLPHGGQSFASYTIHPDQLERSTNRVGQDVPDYSSPNDEYPKDISQLDKERREKLKQSAITINEPSRLDLLKARINKAFEPVIATAKDRLAGWDQDVPTPSGTATNVPDFKHAGYVPPKTEPDPLPPASLNFHGVARWLPPMHGVFDSHSFLKGAATFSTSGNKTAEESQAMLDILAPTATANKNARMATNFPTPAKHAANVWKKVHSTIQANPELHNDMRAHAALHYSRAVHDYFHERGVSEDEKYEKSHIGSMYRDMGHLLAPSDGTVHPALADLGHEMHAIAGDYDTPDTDLVPAVRKFGRDVKAGAIRMGRRAMRSKGMADLRPYLDAIANHPLAQKAGAVVADVHQQWKNFTEEEVQTYCDLLSEGYSPEQWADMFGTPEPVDVMGANKWKKEKGPATFEDHVYNMPREEGGVGIPRHPKIGTKDMPSIDDLDAHPHAGTDTVSKLLSQLYPRNAARRGLVKRATDAVAAALHAHLSALEEHANKLGDAQRNPRDPDAFHELGRIKNDKITISQVSDLAHAIHDHLATDPNDRNQVDHIPLQAHVDHFLRNNSLQAVTARSSVSFAKKTAEVVGPMISKAAHSTASAILDIAHDVSGWETRRGSVLNPLPPMHQPRSTIGKAVARVAIAAPYAAQDVFAGLTGPGITAKGRLEIAQSDLDRSQSYRDKMLRAGLELDPIDKSKHKEAEKRVSRLQAVVGVKAIKKAKRDR